MPEPDKPELIYLGRSRLHRNRANLIQTLHTVAAFTEIGVRTRLYLPPWHDNVTPEQRLGEMGIRNALDIRRSQLLHRRWPISTSHIAPIREILQHGHNIPACGSPGLDLKPAAQALRDVIAYSRAHRAVCVAPAFGLPALQPWKDSARVH